jgi:hypothetical protein
MVFVEKPYMVVVEAKRTEALERQDSQAQLCAQIRSIQIQWLLHSDVNSWLTLVVMKVEREQLRMAANGLCSMSTKEIGTWTTSSQRMTPVQSVFFVLI